MAIRKATMRLLSILSMIVLAGCAAPGPKFSGLKEVPKTNAELIVYRKSALFASATAMPVSVDGAQVGELYNASFLELPLPPGRHSIRVTPGPLTQSAETTVALTAGERKFLHFDFPTGPLANIFFIGVTLDERDEKTALEDIRDLGSAIQAGDNERHQTN